MSDSTPRRQTFIPSVIYKDQRAALKWLEAAFGFEVSELLTDSEGKIAHAQMSYGDSIVMIGSEWFDWTKSPVAVGGMNTQRIHVAVERDIDAHCARARAAGAVIFAEPADQFYGDRTYIAVDPEGHHWSFAQAIKDVSVEDMEKTSGYKFKKLS